VPNQRQSADGGPAGLDGAASSVANSAASHTQDVWHVSAAPHAKAPHKQRHAEGDIEEGRGVYAKFKRKKRLAEGNGNRRKYLCRV